jgi:CRISPR/Cas system-associated exonuclease Cas4 (RecB family)
MNADHLLATLDKAVEDAQDRSHRKHLGASLIGRQCARQLWYVHRWVKKELFTGRMLRLFERGQLEEERFVALLKNAGATVYEVDPQSGKQWRIVDVDGHFGGSCDGVAVNVPQLPAGMACVLEMKTHNSKSFTKLKKDGVAKAKPEHVVQLQTYMLKLEIEVGLYLAVNKDNDELYAEFVALDRSIGERAIRRAQSIIYSEQGPPRISNSPGWFECKFCTFTDICFRKEVPEVNCRTCCHATPGPEGAWTCARGNPQAGDKQQGCPEHLFNPYLLNITRVTSGNTDENWLELLRLDGTTVKTGPNHTASQDLTL